MAKVYSRPGPDVLSAAGKYQIQNNDSVQIVPIPKDISDKIQGIELPNYWFIVCNKCPKHTWFLVNLQEKEAAAAEAVRTEVIQKAVLQDSERDLTP